MIKKLDKPLRDLIIRQYKSLIAGEIFQFDTNAADALALCDADDKPLLEWWLQYRKPGCMELFQYAIKPLAAMCTSAASVEQFNSLRNGIEARRLCLWAPAPRPTRAA